MPNKYRTRAGIPLSVNVNETSSNARLAPGVLVNENAGSGINVNPTGVQGVGTAGTFSFLISPSITPTGVEGTGSAGTFGIAIGPAVNLTGVQGDSAAGTFSITASGNISPSGVQGVGSAGTFRFPTLSITVDEFTVGRIFQRQAGTYTGWSDGTKDIPLTGTYAGGTVTGIDATIGGVLYHCINLVAAGGVWSCTAPAVANGDGYTASVVDTDPFSSASAVQANAWGVGILIAALGQSNMSRMWTQSFINNTPDAHARYTNSNGWWVLNKSLTGTGAPSGCGGIFTMVNTIRAAMAAASPGNVTPIGILAYAISGTAISTWQTGQSSWNAFISGATGVNSTDIGGDFEMAIWHQGEQDSAVGLTPGTYYAIELANILTQCYAQTGRNVASFKFGVAQIGNYQQGIITFSDANIDIIRTAQFAQSQQPGCFFIGACIDYICGTGLLIHYNGGTYSRISKRYANAILAQYGLTAFGSQGSHIQSGSWPIGSNKLTLTVVQESGGSALLDGAGGTSGAGLLGFVVNSTGGQTISSTAFLAGNIVLTMSGNRAVSDVVSASYAGGYNPYGFLNNGSDTDNNVTYDNRAAYISDTEGFPLRPTQGGLANPMSVGGGGAGASSLYFMRRKGRR